MIPSIPTVDDIDGKEAEIMPNIQKVIAYSGLTFYQVLELPCDMFQLMLKNAVIAELQATESGREYLKKCERLNTTEIDYDGVKSLIKGDAN